MSRPRTNIIIAALALFGMLSSISARVNENSSRAGMMISNRAEATYQDDSGAGFTTVSETVTVTIAAVSGVAVTPDEIAPSNTIAPHDQVTRLFRVCNTGNNPDTFTMTALDVPPPVTLAGLYFDSDNSGDSPARDVVITQNVPDGIDYLPDSLQMVKGQASVKAEATQPTEVSRNAIVVRLSLVAPTEVVRLSFRFRITGSFAGGSGVV